MMHLNGRAVGLDTSIFGRVQTFLLFLRLDVTGIKGAERMAKQFNKTSLTVKYIGSSDTEIKLFLPEVPDDTEIIFKLQDPNYVADWKTAYLDMQYEENLNNRSNERSENRVYLDTFTYESRKFFSSKVEESDQIVEQILDESLLEKIEPLLTKRQVEIMYRCLIGGESYVEVAREEGKNEAAIRKTANQIKKKIKKYFF